MRHHRHYHMNFLHYFSSDLSKIELTVWFQTVGRSLIAIFIPIIMLKNDFSLTYIFLFYLLFNLFDIPFNFLARESIYRLGAKKTILIGLISEIIYFVVLYNSSMNISSLVVLAIFAAIYDTFYWVGHWYVFNDSVDKKKGVGKQVGVMGIVRKLASLISPIIGASLLIFVNKEFLIVVSIVFFVFALIPLWRIQDKHTKPNKRVPIKNYFNKKGNKKNYLSITLLGLHFQVEDIILPLFIYMTFLNIESVGFLPVVVTTASMVFMYLVGKFSDKYNFIKLLMLAGGIGGVVWLVRLFANEIIYFYITSVILSFVATFILLQIDYDIIKNNSKSGTLENAVLRNVGFMSFNPIFYIVLIVLLEIFKISFAVAAVALFSLSILYGIIYLRDSRIRA